MSEIAQQKEAQQIQINIIINSAISTKASIARGGLAYGSHPQSAAKRVRIGYEHTQKKTIKPRQSCHPPTSDRHKHI